MAKRGRRPAGEDTRATIIEAARTLFGQEGYNKTTLRGIARAAGVDPALIHHYFNGKPELFTATFAMGREHHPGPRWERLFRDTPSEELGAALVRDFFSTWDAPGNRERFIAFSRSSLTEDEATRATREYLGREVLGRLVTELNPRYQFPQLRASLITATLYGVGMARWVTGHDALAKASVDLLVWHLGPVVQQILDGPIAPDEIIRAQVDNGGLKPQHPELVRTEGETPASGSAPHGGPRKRRSEPVRK